jgi:hypothetical protein
MPVSEQRTQWAEQQRQQLLSIPLISEFVFRSPQRLDGTLQKELADLLVVHKNRAVLVSQKAQEDPDSRDERKNELWVLKNAKAAVSQLVGALRFPTTSFWCDHSRRGRVEFPAGLPPVAHGVVIVETFRPVNLQSAATDLPLQYGGTPVTYLSINDFLNVAMQLRTAPELYAYLDARRDLSDEALRRIGDEQVLLDYYLMHGTFKACQGHQDAQQNLAAQVEELGDLWSRMEDYRYCSSLLEHVADELATRSSSCLEGLSAGLLEKYDPSESRQNYLRMQEVLADLSLRERAELGRQFHMVISGLEGRSQGYTHATAQVDSKPEWVFLFGSSKGWERAGILRCMEPTMGATLSFYKKQHCMIVIDRDGEGYEVALTHPDLAFMPSPTDVLNGEQLFGHLRSTSTIVDGF